MKLGYIITKRKLKNIDSFVEQVSSIEAADPTKPILIVGWENAKKHPKYQNILEKKLDENLFWTFSKSESHVDFEKDLQNFYIYIYNNILNNIKYYYINIYNIKYYKIKKIYNILFNNNKKYIFISNSVIYIPYKGYILGISLRMLEYCHISRQKVLDKVQSVSSNIVIEENNNFIIKLKKRFKNCLYAIPYFYQYCMN